MLYVKNVKYCQAECGEHIDDFAKELVEFRKNNECDIVAKFNGIIVEVTAQTTEKDIIDFYSRFMC